MTIEVYSPHDGEPVKIRDSDVGKAVKDKQGRLFYVLPKSDGSGHYGAMTRAGGERDEQRAADYHAKREQARQSGHQRSAEHVSTSAPGSKGRAAVLVVVAAIIAALAWAVVWGPLKGVLF